MPFEIYVAAESCHAAKVSMQRLISWVNFCRDCEAEEVFIPTSDMLPSEIHDPKGLVLKSILKREAASRGVILNW